MRQKAQLTCRSWQPEPGTGVPGRGADLAGCRRSWCIGDSFSGSTGSCRRHSSGTRSDGPRHRSTGRRCSSSGWPRHSTAGPAVVVVVVVAEWGRFREGTGGGEEHTLATDGTEKRKRKKEQRETERCERKKEAEANPSSSNLARCGGGRGLGSQGPSLRGDGQGCGLGTLKGVLDGRRERGYLLELSGPTPSGYAGALPTDIEAFKTTAQAVGLHLKKVLLEEAVLTLATQWEFPRVSQKRYGDPQLGFWMEQVGRGA